MRFSIKAILLATALVAAGCASIVYPTYGLAAILLLGAILLVLTSVAAAIVLRGPAQAYWIGAAVFGGAYLLLVANFDRVIPNQINSTYSFSLPTTNLIVWCFAQVNRDTQTTQITIGVPTPWLSLSGDIGSWSQWTTQPMGVFSGTFGLQRQPMANAMVGGHSLFTALFVMIGGWIGRRLGSRRQDMQASSKHADLGGPSDIE